VVKGGRVRPPRTVGSEGLGEREHTCPPVMKGQGATFFIGAADPAQIKPEASVLPGNTNAVVLIVLQVGLIEPGPAAVTGQREAMGQEHLEAQIVVPSGTVTEKIMTVVNRVVSLDNFMIYKDIIRLDRPD